MLISGSELWDCKNTIKRLQNDIRYLQQFTGKTTLGLRVPEIKAGHETRVLNPNNMRGEEKRCICTHVHVWKHCMLSMPPWHPLLHA